MLRNIQSIEWDTDSALPRLPHSANLRGPALAFGMQFNFRDPGTRVVLRKITYGLVSSARRYCAQRNPSRENENAEIAECFTCGRNGDLRKLLHDDEERFTG